MNEAMPAWGRVVKAVVALLAGLATIILVASPALAQTVELDPTADGLPGGDMMTNVINWGGQYALYAILLGGIVGVASWVWGAMSANGGRQASGQKIVATMCVAALALGIAPTLVNLFYAAG